MHLVLLFFVTFCAENMFYGDILIDKQPISCRKYSVVLNAPKQKRPHLTSDAGVSYIL